MSSILPTEQAYDVWAATYDDGANPMVALVERLLAREPSLRPRRVVELGCGTGRNLQLFAHRGAHVTGADLSAGMLAVAARRVPDAALLHQDVTRPLPLPDACADLVLVSLVLEHVADPAPVFAESARLLEPGGELRVLELNPLAASGGSRARVRTSDGAEHHTAWHVHTGADLDRAARAHGLAVGALDDVHPDDDLAARFPSPRRPPGTPWLLAGRWRKPA